MLDIPQHLDGLGRAGLTMFPAPRCPTLRTVSFSMIRTGIPFLRRVSAATSPAGPAPTWHKVAQ